MNKKILIGIITLAIALLGCYFIFIKDDKENNNNQQNNNQGGISQDSRVLIVYYSRTNNTETFANYIKEKTNGDLQKIETVEPYPSEYSDMTDVAQKEKNEDARPAIKEAVSVEDYDVIFVGCPIWWGTCPMAMFTYLERENFEGKTIIPFTTSGGSGLGTVEEDLKELTNAKSYLKGLTISGTRIETSKDTVMKWLDSLSIENNEKVKININNTTFDIELEDVETTKEFLELLPINSTMTEMNNNEKYMTLSKKLTTNPTVPTRIQKGDLMLYGDDTLVLFYEDFETTYSYTKIGHITNNETLKEIVSTGDINISISKE